MGDRAGRFARRRWAAVLLGGLLALGGLSVGPLSSSSALRAPVERPVGSATALSAPGGAPASAGPSVTVNSTIVLANSSTVAGNFLAQTGETPYSVAYDPAKSELFVTNFYGGLSVVSIANPRSPRLLSVVPVPTNAYYAAYLPSWGEIAVAAGGTSPVVDLVNDTTDQIVQAIPVTPNPLDVIYDARLGELFVPGTVYPGGGNVSVISLALNRVVATVPLGVESQPGAYDPRNDTVFIPNLESNNISVLSDASDTVVFTISPSMLGPATYPQYVDYDPFENSIWVGTQSGYLEVLNASTYALLQSIYVGSYPGGLVYDAGHHEMFVSNWGTGQVQAISDGPSYSVLATIMMGPAVSTGPRPFYMAYAPSLGSVFVPVSGDGNVSGINDTTYRIVSSLNLDASPRGIAYDAGQRELYVANYFYDDVLVVSTSSNQVVATVPVGRDPTAVVYAPGAGEVFVTNAPTTNPTTGTVSVINDTTNTVVATIAVGTEPNALAYDPSTKAVWVACESSHNITVINATTNTVAIVFSFPGLGYMNNEPAGLVYDPVLNEMFIDCLNQVSLTVLNATSYGVVGTPSTIAGPTTIAYDTSTGQLFVGGSLTSKPDYAVMNASSLATVFSGLFASGAQLFATSYAGATGLVFTTNSGSNVVYVVCDGTAACGGAPAAYRLLATLTVGSGASGAAFDPANDKEYIGNYGQGTLSVVPIVPITTYPVTLRESGLAAATNWSADLGGYLYNATGPTLVVKLPNGTYTCSVPTIAGYLASCPSFTVSGAAASVPVTFERAYAVLLSETGLPRGTVWGLSLNGSYEASNASTFSILEANGTYAYNVTPVAGFVAAPWRGQLVVAGPGSTVAVAWTQKNYSVVFTESGLPAGRAWSVNLSGRPANSSTSSLTFSEPNGSYLYAAPSIAGYAVSNASGSITVLGAPTLTHLTFTRLPVKYNLTFIETGLPALTRWNLTLAGEPASTNSTSILETEVNGSYAFLASSPGYVAAPAEGTVVVQGGNVARTIVFSPATFNVSFLESGLPADSRWGVDVGGTVAFSSGPYVSFALPNGTYPYSIEPVPGFSTPHWSGVVRVQGLPLPSLPVPFTAFSWPVVFAAEGLAEGRSWTVTFDGVTNGTSGPSVGFAAPNGTYAFSVHAPSGYNATPATGSLSVSGAPGNETIVFSYTGITTYAVTFAATGYPVAFGWTVNVSGRPSVGSTAPSAVLELVNGSYDYNYSANRTAWQGTAEAGRFVVRGAAVTVELPFEELFEASVTATGLPPGTLWYVNVSAVSVAAAARPPSGPGSYSGTGPVLSFSLANGTYRYTVASGDPAWRPVSSGGSISVRGAAPTPNVAAFEALYLLTFTESGLPSGTLWNVSVNATVFSSATTGISLWLPNATYPFTVPELAGYSVQPSGGSVTLAGAPESIALVFSRSGSSSAAPGLPPLDLLVVGVALAAVVAAALVALARRRRAPTRPTDAPPRDGAPREGTRGGPPSSSAVPANAREGAATSPEEYEEYGRS